MYLSVGNAMEMQIVEINLTRWTVEEYRCSSVTMKLRKLVKMDFVSLDPGGVMVTMIALMLVMRLVVQLFNVEKVDLPVVTRGSVYWVTGNVMGQMTVRMEVMKLVARILA